MAKKVNEPQPGAQQTIGPDPAPEPRKVPKKAEEPKEDPKQEEENGDRQSPHKEID